VSDGKKGRPPELQFFGSFLKMLVNENNNKKKKLGWISVYSSFKLPV